MNQKPVLICSFCGIDSNDKTVIKIVQSKKNPDIYICNNCVAVAKELADEEKKK